LPSLPTLMSTRKRGGPLIRQPSCPTAPGQPGNGRGWRCPLAHTVPVLSKWVAPRSSISSHVDMSQGVALLISPGPRLSLERAATGSLRPSVVFPKFAVNVIARPDGSNSSPQAPEGRRSARARRGNLAAGRALPPDCFVLLPRKESSQ